MQDTVDQACGAVPRTLANIIEDARASRTAAGDEGYRQVGGGDRADRSARLPAPAPVIAAGTTAATVVLPGLLAPDVASGQGLQPVKGSGPG
jgi:hypothetical protein